MLHINQAATLEKLIVTLFEKQTLDGPFFIFEFTGVTSKEVVTTVKAYGDDLSSHRSRYNEFTINPSSLFANKQPGQWRYVVYESADGTTKGDVLELGKMLLTAAGVTLKTYTPEAATYKAYGS